MLTVADALQFEEFQGARVVAGRGGLNKIVTWVHIASVPDAPAWLNGGELVLTTPLNMPNDHEEQRRYLQAMSDSGASGLALAVGRFLNSVPDDLRTIAEQNNFPLIEIPYQARFIDIAKGVNQRITQENMTTVERALTIHRVLTQLVLDGGDLKDLAEKLAGLVGHSISIENERFEALASANIAPVDEARRYTLSEGRTNPMLLQALEQHGILGTIRKTLRPVSIPQMPEVGLEMERILAPVVVHGDVYGYLWIIADGQPLNQFDYVAIESGATVAALILLHQEAVLAAEASLKGGLLSQLIQGDTEVEMVLADQALRYGLDLTAPFAMLVADSSERSSQKLLSLYRRANRLAGTHGWRAVIGQFAGQLVLLAQADSDMAQIAQTIIAQGGNGLRVSVSATHRGVTQVPAAHKECLDALYITRRLASGQQVAYFNNLGYLHTLYCAGADSLASNPYAPFLRRLLREQQADLFHTLEEYLDAGGNGVATADLLMIHRSTLNYRLSRIAEVSELELGRELDLGDPLLRTNLQIALKLLRLFEVEKQD